MFYQIIFPPEVEESEVEESEEAEGLKKNVSPFAKTTILFTRPAQNLASGKLGLVK